MLSYNTYYYIREARLITFIKCFYLKDFSLKAHKFPETMSIIRDLSEINYKLVTKYSCFLIFNIKIFIGLTE